jgi:hypothetical protein
MAEKKARPWWLWPLGRVAAMWFLTCGLPVFAACFPKRWPVVVVAFASAAWCALWAVVFLAADDGGRRPR